MIEAQPKEDQNDKSSFTNSALKYSLNKKTKLPLPFLEIYVTRIKMQSQNKTNAMAYDLNTDLIDFFMSSLCPFCARKLCPNLP